MTTRTRNAKNQKAYRDRERKKFMNTLDHLIDDVDIFTEWKDGKRVVTFDMSRETNAALELVAGEQGKTLDDILRAVVAKNLKEAANLKELKEKYGKEGK